MSQTTTTELLNNLGLTAAGVDHPKARVDSVGTPPKRRNLVVALASLVILGAGFKVLGDYVTEQAINTWAERQQIQFSVVDPKVAAIVAQWAKEAEAEALAESQAATGNAAQ